MNIQRIETNVKESISLTYEEAGFVNSIWNGDNMDNYWGITNISDKEFFKENGYYEATATVGDTQRMIETGIKVYSTDGKSWMSENYKSEAEEAEAEDKKGG